jgi:hypothetical protein
LFESLDELQRGMLWLKRKRKNVAARQKKRAENVVATARKKRIN